MIKTKAMKKLLLGHESNREADLKFPDRSISNRHLEIEALDRNSVRITDLDSTNGTEINGQAIVSKILKNEDSIRIGFGTYGGHEIIDRAYSIWDMSKMIWKQEFEQLLIYKRQYDQERVKIANDGKWTRIIINVIVFGIFAIIPWHWGKELGISSELRPVISMGSGTFALLVTSFFEDRSKMETSKIELRNRYKNLLVCPKCKAVSYMDEPIQSLEQLQRCPRNNCMAIYKA
ncbi:MAG: FHA domain-containing protein [Ignavibacteriae bacterium]|nr:FHA domain-containing protein [Ignavibacteriota bacterium]